MSHIPGPWTVEQDVVNNGDIHVFAGELRPLALIDVREYPEDTDGIPRETALANARLIAAAPELLEDLRFIHMIAKARNSDAAWRDVEMVAANAIAKTEGRS